MISPRATFAIGLVRAWTRVYTWHMQPDLRARRHAEIESDLWEFQRDAEAHRGVSPEVQIIVRLLRGVPHDLGWRVEQQAEEMGTRARLLGTAAVSATVAILLGALWLVPLLRPSTLPQLLPIAWPVSRALPGPRALPPPVCAPPQAAGVVATYEIKLLRTERHGE